MPHLPSVCDVTTSVAIVLAILVAGAANVAHQEASSHGSPRAAIHKEREEGRWRYLDAFWMVSAHAKNIHHPPLPTTTQ